jgi:hypothetical protein
VSSATISEARGSSVNTASGAVVEQIDHDEFDNVTSDTNAGLTPFGIAGGLADADTRLVQVARALQLPSRHLKQR